MKNKKIDYSVGGTEITSRLSKKTYSTKEVLADIHRKLKSPKLQREREEERKNTFISSPSCKVIENVIELYLEKRGDLKYSKLSYIEVAKLIKSDMDAARLKLIKKIINEVIMKEARKEALSIMLLADKCDSTANCVDDMINNYNKNSFNVVCMAVDYAKKRLVEQGRMTQNKADHFQHWEF